MDSNTVLQSLAALAQDTRLALFRLLVEQGPVGLTPGRIAEALAIPAATLSFHLKELETSGLIDARRESRFIHYSANFDAMNGLVSYLTENCCRASGNCEAACPPDCDPKRIPRRVSAKATSTRRRAA
jgi:DNA-binding transcriptional ArsR family regulator